MFDIRRYTEADKAVWDTFVAQSKNGTFLFFRDYMDYHADRFRDHSLMIYLDGSLYALQIRHIGFLRHEYTASHLSEAQSVELFQEL